MDNSEKEKNNKRKKERKILIIVLFVILGCCFVVKSIINFSKKDVDTYLKFKYHKNFEMIDSDNRQYVIPGLSCDGSYCIPDREVEGKYEYIYTMYSKKDNIEFKVYLVDDNGKKEYKDSYKFMKNVDSIINKTEKNFKKITDYELNLELDKPTSYKLNYRLHGNVLIDENGIDVIDKEYINTIKDLNRIIKNKLDKEVAKYKKQVNFDYDIDITFNDEVTISLSDNYDDTTIRLFLKAKYSKTLIELDELKEYTSLKDYIKESDYEYPPKDLYERYEENSSINKND